MFLTEGEKVHKKKERMLLVFAPLACGYKRIFAEEEGKCPLILEKESLGIREEEEVKIVLREDKYCIKEQTISENQPFYYETAGREKLLFLLEPERKSLSAGTLVLLKREQRLVIGNAYQNAIFYDCFSLIQGQMAEICREEEGYVVKALVKAGIYHNEHSLKGKTVLKTGDRLDIYGLHLLFLGELLLCCIRTGIGRIAEELKEPVRLPFLPKCGMLRQNAMRKEQWVQRYRQKEEALHEGEVEILLPEPVRQEKETPLLLGSGPAVTMVLPMLFMAWIGSLRGDAGGFYWTSVAMSGCSALLALFWGVVNHCYRLSMQKKEEKDRRYSYQEYLRRMREQLKGWAEENQRILSQRYPAAEVFGDEESTRGRVMWNRYYRQPDFLFLRIGTGSIPFQVCLKTAGGKQRIKEDALWEEARGLVEEFQELQEAPIGVSLWHTRQFGVIEEKERQNTYCILSQLLVQLAAGECYTEVKLVCFYQKKLSLQRQLAEGLKWLRHCWSPDGKLRYLAGDETEAAKVIPTLTRELLEQSQKQQKLPFYVVLVLNEELVRGEVLYQYLLHPDAEYPVSAIFVKKSREELPKSCVCYIEGQELVSCAGEHIRRQKIRLSAVGMEAAQKYFRNIYPFRVKEEASQQQLPEKLSFLQMYGCSRVEELDCGVRWKRSNIRQRLKVPIGAGVGGALVFLDVHEKFHGPHGLIAGTTGAGKSELLQTYLLSLAVNFSPEDVNFFMIDYKGGGTGNLLKKLPHCAGVISNLSGKQIKRAMSAIISENRRRQQLLGSMGLNHIDAYTLLYREKRVTEPMPHLVLVVDEFAELKKEEPEFMQELISLAQVGRSLGVHLLLATQKPAGTVDERIWSNARFRLCLRVQDAQDSMDVLHNKDAAMLTIPGRCYLQIGNQEYYELFQTGYCGEPYRQEPKETPSVVMLNEVGERVCKRGQKGMEGGPSQLERVIDHVNQTAEREQTKTAGQLWLPELSERIYLEELKKMQAVREGEKETLAKDIRVWIGLCDDPENQRQFPFCYVPGVQGHLCVCGAPMTGKSTMLRTILWQLCTDHSPAQVQTAVIDMGRESMRCFLSMPGCLGVLSSQLEEDIFFYHMTGLFQARKKLLSGVSFRQYNRTAKEPLPCVFLGIDNFGLFYKQLEEEKQDFLLRLAAEGAGNGIYLILTAAAFGEIPGRLYEKLKTTISLEMSDRFAYGDVLRQYYIPVLPKENTAGRGLVKLEGRILEFQTALPFFAEDDYEQMKRIKEWGEACACSGNAADKEESEKGQVILPFPHIPQKEDYDRLWQREEAFRKQVLLGCSLKTGKLLGWEWEKDRCFLVTGTDKKAVEKLLNSMTGELLKAGQQVLYPEDVRKLCAEADMREPDAEAVFPAGSSEEESRARVLCIPDAASFCQQLYGRKPSEGGEASFFERVAEGKKYDFKLLIGYYGDAGYETEGSCFFKAAAKDQVGIHLGGNAAAQRVFSFDDFSYTQLNRAEPYGIGYYKRGKGKAAERLLLAGMEEENGND